MIINHPLLGPRDAAEFTYLGDACLLNRPDGSPLPADTDAAQNAAHEAGLADAFHDYVHLRDNPAGWHKELWYHEQGDRAWLIVERHTVTHEIRSVRLARDVAREASA